MKKLGRKLALHRETLSTLQSDHLEKVAGGRTQGPTCAFSCDPNTVIGCITARDTCDCP